MCNPFHRIAIRSLELQSQSKRTSCVNRGNELQSKRMSCVYRGKELLIRENKFCKSRGRFAIQVNELRKSRERMQSDGTNCSPIERVLNRANE